MTRLIYRLEAWALLALGLAAGVVLPHPVTTALWTGAARAFDRADDAGIVQRLTSGTKFGSRIRAGLDKTGTHTHGGDHANLACALR